MIEYDTTVKILRACVHCHNWLKQHSGIWVDAVKFGLQLTWYLRCSR